MEDEPLLKHDVTSGSRNILLPPIDEDEREEAELLIEEEYNRE